MGYIQTDIIIIDSPYVSLPGYTNLNYGIIFEIIVMIMPDLTKVIKVLQNNMHQEIQKWMYEKKMILI